MKNNICIIIQGPSSQENILKNKKAWENEKIIFSCWEGEEELYDEKDDVIFNKIPSKRGAGNLFLQIKSSYNGIIYAYNKGYEKVIKWRSDMIPTNKNEFLKLFNKDLNFMFWHNYNGGYILDYFMGGTIELMIKLWNIEENLSSNVLFPEQALTQNFFIKNLHKENFHFIGKKIDIHNDIYWIKYNKYLSSYNEDPLFIDYICENVYINSK